MARGGRDIYYFLRLPLLEEKSKFFNLFSDCPLMTCSSCLANLLSSICLCGVAKIHFCLLDTAEMVYAPRSTGMAANFLLRKPNGRLGGPARLLLPVGSARIRSAGTPQQPRVLFCSKNRKSSRNLVFIVPSEPVIECQREVRGRAT
jgi:hypothetical protein